MVIFPLLITLFIGKASAEAPQPTPEEKYNLALDTWLGKLAMCESTNNPNAVNPKDSDNLPAYGKYQYKLGTFLGLSKKYNVYPELTIDLVHKYAMDGEKSYHLTKVAISTNPKEANQWGCTRKIGKPPVKEDYLQK